MKLLSNLVIKVSLDAHCTEYVHCYDFKWEHGSVLFPEQSLFFLFGKFHNVSAWWTKALDIIYLKCIFIIKSISHMKGGKLDESVQSMIIYDENWIWNVMPILGCLCSDFNNPVGRASQLKNVWQIG